MREKEFIRQEAIFLAALLTLIAAYKIWRFWNVSNNVTKFSLLIGIAANAYGWYIAFSPNVYQRLGDFFAEQ